MFNIDQFRQCIVKPTLLELIAYSEDAIEMMIFTAAVESRGGTYLKQMKGPALGIYQMEPNTYNDLWQNYILNKSSLLLILTTSFGINGMPHEDRLIYDLRFATAMARIFYMRVPEILPRSKNINDMWNYYKKYYNTASGTAEKDASISKYKLFIHS